MGICKVIHKKQSKNDNITKEVVKNFSDKRERKINTKEESFCVSENEKTIRNEMKSSRQYLTQSITKQHLTVESSASEEINETTVISKAANYEKQQETSNIVENIQARMKIRSNTFRKVLKIPGKIQTCILTHQMESIGIRKMF